MIMKTRNMRLGAAIAAVTFAMAGAAWADPTPGQYNIGIISDDTGPVASAGISYHRGADLAIEEINAKGFAGEGVTLNLLVKDSGTDAARAVQAMTQFAADRTVLATTCCIITPIAGALVPIAMNNKLPLVIYGATRDGLPQEPYVTSVVALPGPQEVMMARRLAEELKPKRVAYYVTGDNDIFLTRAHAVKAVFEEAGAETVAEISTLANDTDFTGQPWQEKAKAYRLAMPGYKHIGFLRGGSSNAFTGHIARTNASEALLFQALLAMTTAYLKAYADYDREAFGDMTNDLFERMTLGAVDEGRR